MSVGPINGFSPLTSGVLRPEGPQAAAPAALQRNEGPGFAERVGAAVNDLAEAQNNARQSATDFELGRETDLASVMIDQQISSLGFQFALNVRNKALGAYRDIMNMPV